MLVSVQGRLVGSRRASILGGKVLRTPWVTIRISCTCLPLTIKTTCQDKQLPCPLVQGVGLLLVPGLFSFLH